MNNKIKSEKFRKLSIAALVTGILAIILTVLGVMELLFFELFSIAPLYKIAIYSVTIGLAIAAVVCGSIDFKRIKKGRYSRKGRGFDIAGIGLGPVPILISIILLLMLIFGWSKGGYAWSPDGKKIAFSSDRDGNIEIYVMNTDGSNQVNLTNSPEDEWSPAWSPDGKIIAFGRDNELYVMNTDGSNQVNLTNSPEDEWSPAWSPNGKKIAFESSEKVGYSDIYIIDNDGSNRINLTNNPQYDSSPAWSPDGKIIAFGRDNELYVMNADGSDQKRLTD
jgi:Tol biopolymer transport system component